MNEWQPIATSPEDGSWFLTWGQYSGYRVERRFREVPLSTSIMAPTHWMPLPAPPVAAPGDEERR
jgi:hypothetical protein